MGPKPGTQLTAGALQQLADTLTVELLTRLPADGEDGYPPGARDYDAQFVVRWFRDDVDEMLTASDNLFLRGYAKTHDIDIEQDAVEIPIGRGHFVLVDLDAPELHDALDAREGDLETLAANLFVGPDDDGRNLAPGLADKLEIIESYATLVNHVSVAEPFRGRKIGLRGTGAVLQEMRRGCAFAALYPMTPGLSEESERRSARQALRSYWSQLGFTGWNRDVMVLSLVTTQLDKSLRRLGVG